jgi:hypothetical protein
MVARRAIAVWLVFISAEIVHGIVRGMLFRPYVGDLRARQIGVFSGSIIFLAIAVAFVGWLGATRASQLLGVGALWLVLTAVFEVSFGYHRTRRRKGYVWAM